MGDTGTPIFCSWSNMVHLHPGEIDQRWLDYKSFKSDMGLPPKKHCLTRLDDSKPYSKSNCCWATRTEIGQKISKKPSAQLLRKLAWAIPVAVIARHYGVADTTVFKWFDKNKIEHPGPGYWAAGARGFRCRTDESLPQSIWAELD